MRPAVWLAVCLSVHLSVLSSVCLSVLPEWWFYHYNSVRISGISLEFGGMIHAKCNGRWEFCSACIIEIGMKVEWIFHCIWITMKKSSMRPALGLHVTLQYWCQYITLNSTKPGSMEPSSTDQFHKQNFIIEPLAKVCVALMWIIVIQKGHNFAHATTAELSWPDWINSIQFREFFFTRSVISS